MKNEQELLKENNLLKSRLDKVKNVAKDSRTPLVYLQQEILCIVAGLRDKPVYVSE